MPRCLPQPVVDTSDILDLVPALLSQTADEETSPHSPTLSASAFFIEMVETPRYSCLDTKSPGGVGVYDKV